MAAIAAAVSTLVSGAAFATPTVTQVIGPAGADGSHKLTSPWGTGADGAGNVYVAGVSDNDVLRLAAGGALSVVIDGSGDGAGHPMQVPEELAVANDGTVYVAALGSVNVFKIPPAGAPTQILDATGDGAGHPLQYPHALAVDPSGNVFVADTSSNYVFRVDATTGQATIVIDASGDGAGHALAGPSALATDAAGVLYVAGQDSDNVFQVTPGGAITEIVHSTPGYPLDYPDALAVDGAGNVYVGAFTSENVLRVAPGGGVADVMTSVHARQVTLRPDGIVLVADDNGKRIVGRRPSGPDCVVIDASGDGTTPMGFAIRFALAPSGAVYVSNVSFGGVFQVDDACGLPSVDLSGRWHVEVAGVPEAGVPPASFNQDWVQSGFDITVTDPDSATTTFTGTIDDRNQFWLQSVGASCYQNTSLCCPYDYLWGAATADGWAGYYSYNSFTPRFMCFAVFSPAAAGTHCGNGQLDPGEECEDGNVTPGDGCDATCHIEPCGNGTLDPGEQCDDGNLVSGDGCSSTCIVDCPAAPETGCRQPIAPGKSTVLLKNTADPVADQMTWKWGHGATTPKADFGAPLGLTNYAMCVYDATGLVLSARVPSAMSGGTGTWTDEPTGYRFRNSSTSGRMQLVLKEGTVSGAAKIVFKARGDATTTMPNVMALTSPLTIQIRNGDVCWGAVYSAPFLKLSNEKLKAKSD